MRFVNRRELFGSFTLAVGGMSLVGCDVVQAVGGLTGAMTKATVFPAATVNVPFAVSVAGSTVEADVRNSAEYTYRFWVILIAGTTAEANHIRKTAGDGGRIMGGELANGIPMPVRLVVTRVGGPPRDPLIDRRFGHYGLAASGRTLDGTADYLAYEFWRMKLARGMYRLHVEAMNDIPELQATPARFWLSAPSVLGG